MECFPAMSVRIMMLCSLLLSDWATDILLQPNYNPTLQLIHRVNPVIQLIKIHVTTVSQADVKRGTIKSSFQKNGKYLRAKHQVHIYNNNI